MKHLVTLLFFSGAFFMASGQITDSLNSHNIRQRPATQMNVTPNRNMNMDSTRIMDKMNMDSSKINNNKIDLIKMDSTSSILDPAFKIVWVAEQPAILGLPTSTIV